MQHHPKIALGDLQLLADFPIGSFFNLVKLEDLRDAWRQFPERHLQSFAQLGQFHSATWFQALTGSLMCPKHGIIPGLLVRPGGVINMDLSLSAYPSEMIKNFVSQDSDQPGSVGRPARESVPSFECRQKSVLHEVLRD